MENDQERRSLIDDRYMAICCERIIDGVLYSTKEAEVLHRRTRGTIDFVLYLSRPWKRSFLVRTEWVGNTQNSTIRCYERKVELLEDMARIFGPGSLEEVDVNVIRFPEDAVEPEQPAIDAGIHSI